MATAFQKRTIELGENIYTLIMENAKTQGQEVIVSALFERVTDIVWTQLLMWGRLKTAKTTICFNGMDVVVWRDMTKEHVRYSVAIAFMKKTQARHDASTPAE